MFKDPLDCYETMAAILDVAAIKYPWSQIDLEASLDGQQVDTVVACRENDTTEPIAYLTGMPKLARCIYELARLVSTQDKGLFKRCNFTLYRGGKFNVDFFY